MKQEYGKDALFRKFMANRCSPEEIEQILQYLCTRDADTILHRLIAQQLQEAALSNERMDSGLTEEMRSQILSRLQQPVVQEMNGKVFEKRKTWTAWKIAAVFAGMLLLAGATYYRLFMHSPWIVRETGYGEIATLILPDSSEVVLNSNSSIRYAREWGAQHPREVWIDGEVYFSVRHTMNDQKFVVHPSNNFDVEVLGTEFTVYNRSDASRIVLNSGKVQLNIHNKKVNDQVHMQPGDLVELEEQSGTYEKHKVNPQLYTSWVNGKIVLDNTSFREISNLLRETYGLSVKVPDSALYNERFTGMVPSDNIESLLKALGLAFGLEIETDGKNVVFKIKSY